MAPFEIPLWWMLFCSTQYSDVTCEVFTEDGQFIVMGLEDCEDDFEKY